MKLPIWIIAACMIRGASYDNNLLCIAEKEVFVVESVFDALMSAMQRAGAYRLNSQQVQKLTEAAFSEVGEDRHLAPTKELLGQDALNQLPQHGSIRGQPPSCCLVKRQQTIPSWLLSR